MANVPPLTLDNTLSSESLWSCDSAQFRSEPSYDIRHLQDFHDIDPSWRDDDIEEIMLIREKPRLPQVIKFSSANDAFHLLSVVGTGVTAKIILAKRPHSFKLYAIKRMHRSTLSSRGCLHDAISEQLILRTITLLNAPFLPRLYSSFADPQYLYLVMDFCARGDLLTHLLKDGALDPDAARFYASELIVGISSLHQARIVHRDLKPENILIDIAGHIVITDFGCAKQLLPQETTCGMISSSFCGTKEYQPPEMILEWSHDFAVDVWGFGVLLYMLNFGQHPFMREDDRSELSTTIHKSILADPVMSWTDEILPPLVDLIRQCLERNPVLRPKIDGIKDHDYFSSTDWNDVASKRVSVPPCRILDSSNIHIPLNSIEDGMLPSLDIVDTSADYDRSGDTFSFEWDGVSEVDRALFGEIDSDDSVEHVPTILNPIEEVSESEERNTVTTANSVPALQEDPPIAANGTSTQNIFKQLSHNYAQFRNRCKKIFARHMPASIMLSVDQTSSLSAGPPLSVTATSSPLCHPGGMFFRRKFGWKRSSDSVDSERSLDQQQTVQNTPALYGNTWILPLGGSDLRLCRHHRLHGAIPF